MNEQPLPSELYFEEPWPEVISDPTVVILPIDQCMLDQTGPSGLPAKKRTGLYSNSPYLLQPLKYAVCDGSHVHEQ